MTVNGFDQLKLQLFDLLKSQKLHHANVISGKRGIGKASFIKQFCLEALGSLTDYHPNLKIIAKEENKSEISIDAIRSLKNFINLTSADGDPKFIIIDSACELNHFASNALLKNLEEPHQNNYFFLITHNLNMVIPTLRSRCGIIKIPEFNDIIFKKIISQYQQFNDEETEFLMAISDKSPALAIQYSQDLIRFYQLFLDSILKQQINDEILKKIALKNFSFIIIETIITTFFSRFIKNFHKLNHQSFFGDQEVFALLSLKFSLAQALDLAESSTKNFKLISEIYLDKKLFFINIFNKICYEKI